jgi:hypothetical protein
MLSPVILGAKNLADKKELEGQATACAGAPSNGADAS